QVNWGQVRACLPQLRALRKNSVSLIPASLGLLSKVRLISLVIAGMSQKEDRRCPCLAVCHGLRPSLKRHVDVDVLATTQYCKVYGIPYYLVLLDVEDYVLY